MRKGHISMSHWNYSTVEKIFVGEPNTVHASGGPVGERVGYESLCQVPLWPGGPQCLAFGVHFQAVCAYKRSPFLQWKNSIDLLGILSLAHLWGSSPYPKGIVCRTAGKFVFPTHSLSLFRDSKGISYTRTALAAWLLPCRHHAFPQLLLGCHQMGHSHFSDRLDLCSWCKGSIAHYHFYSEVDLHQFWPNMNAESWIWIYCPRFWCNVYCAIMPLI